MRRLCVVLLTASLGACAAKAQVRSEVEVPLLDPPPPPPRVVTSYVEPEPLPISPPAEPVTPAKPAPRPPRPQQPAEPANTTPEQPVVDTIPRPSPPPSLTLTPSPGSEAQTVTAIRDLLRRASSDLSRVNAGALSRDGRSQYDTARRFLQQAEEALTARNIVFAGRLADKAATMAAILVR